MADYDQILRALRNAHAAGDTASAQRLARMAQATRQGALTRDPAAGADPRVDRQPGAVPAAAQAPATTGEAGMDYGDPMQRAFLTHPSQREALLPPQREPMAMGVDGRLDRAPGTLPANPASIAARAAMDPGWPGPFPPRPEGPAAALGTPQDVLVSILQRSDSTPEQRAMAANLLVQAGVPLPTQTRGPLLAEAALPPGEMQGPESVPAWSVAGRVAAGEGVAPMSPTNPVPDNPDGRNWLASWANDGNPNTFSRGEQFREAGLRSLESLTFGLAGDEAAAGVGALLGRGSYEDQLAERQEQARLYQEQYPADALAADLAPMVIPGIGAAQWVARGATRGAKLARSMALGSAGGATSFAMDGDERGGRAMAALQGAALGGAFGYAIPRAAEALQGLPRNLGRLAGFAAQRPTVEALRSLKTAAYQAVEQAGHTFSTSELQGLVSTVRNAFSARHYVDDVDTAARAALRTIENQANGPLTLSQLDSIRQSLWSRYQSAKDQPMILDAIHAIDTLVDNHGGASALMATARAANRTFRVSQLLEDAMTKVEDQVASTGSGGNILNKMRQAVTSIINDPARARFLNEAEIAAMRQFVRGDNTQNVLRLVGKLSPTGNGLMLALHTLSVAGGNGMFTVPAAAIGLGAKAAADGIGRLRMSNVQDMVAGVAPAAGSISPAAGALGAMTAPALENAVPNIRSRPMPRPERVQR